MRNIEFVWNEETNDKLLHLVATRGNNWKLFEKHFEGCTKQQIKQQYTKLKKEGRYPTGFEKQINRQRCRRQNVQDRVIKMPTIVEEHSDDDMSELKRDGSSISIKLSIKETVLHGGSLYKSATSSQKKYSKYLRNQC